MLTTPTAQLEAEPDAEPVNPDQVLHLFRTVFGIPPDTDTPPACGATLTPAYDFPGGPGRPTCTDCRNIAKAEGK